MSNNKTKKEKEDKMTRNIFIGGAAVGGVLLLSSFSSGIFDFGDNSQVPVTPIGPDGSNPNNVSDFGTGADGGDTPSWIRYATYIGLGLGAIALILIKYKDARDAWRDLREKEEEEGEELDFNDFGFYDRNLFSQPGDYALSHNNVQWGANPGGAFSLIVPSFDLNHHFQSNNFSLSSFESAFKGVQLQNANLFNADGSWNYTPGYGGGFAGLSGFGQSKTKSGLICCKNKLL